MALHPKVCLLFHRSPNGRFVRSTPTTTVRSTSASTLTLWTQQNRQPPGLQVSNFVLQSLPCNLLIIGVYPSNLIIALIALCTMVSLRRVQSDLNFHVNKLRAQNFAQPNFSFLKKMATTGGICWQSLTEKLLDLLMSPILQNKVLLNSRANIFL